MVFLPDVTLIAVAGSKHGETIAAIRKSLKEITPAKTVLITNMRLTVPGIEVHYCDNLNTWEEYNEFIIDELYKFFNTSHCLVIQWDGYVLDGKQWRDDFLNWDWIGAKWLYKDRNVGNGGYSMRSHKLQKMIAEMNFDVKSPEDEVICRFYVNQLKAKGIKFAPEDVADRFSFELNQPEQKTFGFHGFHQQPFKPYVVLKRSYAMGDVIMLEPMMEWWDKKGFQVALDIEPWLMPLFANLPYKVVHVTEIKSKEKPGGLIFDMAYENRPQQLVLQAYYDHVGITDGIIRNPDLNYKVPDNIKLFGKYAVVHINKTDLPYRNVYGVNWKTVQDYLEAEGYQVIQIGDTDQRIGTWINTVTTDTLMYIISGASLFIGSDSGPAHIAVGCKVPSVILFGSVNPAFRFASFENISIVQKECPYAGCYHTEVSTSGVSCRIDQDKPPCTQFTAEDILKGIKKFNMQYHCESDKIRPKIQKYLSGTIIDIGCAAHKITPDAIGVDGYAAEGVNVITTDLYNLSSHPDLPKADVVFSSHCLEHLTNDTAALQDWAKLLKHRGFLILYLPSAEKYNNANNEFHFREYTLNSFLFYFKRVFCGEGVEYNKRIEPIFEVIEAGNDFGYDKYSLYLIAQKL